MSEESSILAGFEPISLKKVECLGQLKRRETKFLVPAGQLNRLLQALQPHYKLLLIKNDPVQGYHSQYFDTAGFDMYLDHHNGKLNRFKIRERTYLASNKTYLELKFSDNTQRIFKYRMPQKWPGNIMQAEAVQFIEAATPYTAVELHPSVAVSYNRIALLGKTTTERLTIDTDVQFLNGDAGVKLSNFAVVEVKQTERIESVALKTLKELGNRPRAFSKYCLGVNCLYPALKKNRFKQKLRELIKLVHDPSFNLAAGS